RTAIATTSWPVCRPGPAAGVAGSTLTISTARVFASPSARASRRSNGRDCPPKPRYARETRPRARSCGTTHVAVSMGTAKLMPCAIAKTAELMPTTRPRESTSGPPELPGLSATSVWMMLSMSRPVVLRGELPRALSTPAATAGVGADAHYGGADGVDDGDDGVGVGVEQIGVGAWRGRRAGGLLVLGVRGKRFEQAVHRTPPRTFDAPHRSADSVIGSGRR